MRDKCPIVQCLLFARGEEEEGGKGHFKEIHKDSMVETLAKSMLGCSLRVSGSLMIYDGTVVCASLCLLLLFALLFVPWQTALKFPFVSHYKPHVVFHLLHHLFCLPLHLTDSSTKINSVPSPSPKIWCLLRNQITYQREREKEENTKGSSTNEILIFWGKFSPLIIM